MAEVVLERRVINLEEMMATLIEETTRLSREMREFKEESRLSREKSEADLEAYRQEWRSELQAYRQKSEADLEAYRQEWRSEFEAHRETSEADTKALRREFNQKHGQLINKMGTLAEDLVAPSLPRILQEVVPCPADEIVSMAVRVRRPHRVEKNRSQEYDVIASCGQYALFNETKSRLRTGDVEGLLERLEQARDYFPEYEGYKIIGSLASLYVDPSLVKHASRQGILILATGDELMEVLNEPGLVLREF